MNEQIKINWYRCKVDREVMRQLTKTSDLRGLCQVIPQLALFVVTGTLAYMAFLMIHPGNWAWAVPLLLVALFVHGTFSAFLGLGGPVHELCHKTPFRSKRLNEFFLKLYSFISWSDYVGFRPSHVKHHQVTVHDDHDGEVVLPQSLDWRCVRFFVTILACDPALILRVLTRRLRATRGNESDWAAQGEWMTKVIPAANTALRREHRRWARIQFFGHAALAGIFIATGHWFLIVVFTLAVFYSGWLALACSMPQHIGLCPNVPDFRLCCRTYTCSWLPAFLYWNMQYHVEHHMFPSVPFYNLPNLRRAIENDLPPAPHGLWSTWKEILPILDRQKKDPRFVFVPPLKSSATSPPLSAA